MPVHILLQYDHKIERNNATCTTECADTRSGYVHDDWHGCVSIASLPLWGVAITVSWLSNPALLRHACTAKWGLSRRAEWLAPQWLWVARPEQAHLGLPWHGQSGSVHITTSSVGAHRSAYDIVQYMPSTHVTARNSGIPLGTVRDGECMRKRFCHRRRSGAVCSH